MALRRRGEFIFSARGFTLLEVLIVCALLGIIAAITTSFLVRARIAANEAAAIGTLRAVNSAQMAYSSSCGANSFSPTFARLVAGNYASPDMNLNPKSGYAFTLGPSTGAAGKPDCTSQPTQTKYYASALPVSVATGRRAFATNVGAAIWQDDSGAAPTEPFTPGPNTTPIQ